MHDPGWFVSAPLAGDGDGCRPAVGISLWLDDDMFGELRDRTAIGGPRHARNARPFIREDGPFRSLHFSIFHLQSEMDVRRPLRLTIDYTRMMMGFMLFHVRPKRIEMVGLGGGSLAKYCHHNLPDADICVAEIDPEVIALRDMFLIPRDGPRFRVVQQDGADFVRYRSDRPDILLVDGFDRYGQSPQLCTSGFYKACRDRLMPGGIMVANLSGSHGEKSAIATRITSIFEGHVLSVAAEGGRNRVVFAGKDEQPVLTPEALAGALERLDIDQRHFLASAGRRILRQLRRHERRVQYERKNGSGAGMGGSHPLGDQNSGKPT